MFLYSQGEDMKKIIIVFAVAIVLILGGCTSKVSTGGGEKEDTDKADSFGSDVKEGDPCTGIMKMVDDKVFNCYNGVYVEVKEGNGPCEEETSINGYDCVSGKWTKTE